MMKRLEVSRTGEWILIVGLRYVTIFLFAEGFFGRGVSVDTWDNMLVDREKVTKEDVGLFEVIRIA